MIRVKGGGLKNRGEIMGKVKVYIRNLMGKS